MVIELSLGRRHFTQRVRDRRSRQSYHKARLRIRWRELGIDGLRVYLQKILITENQTHPLHPHRLSGISRYVVRARRLAVAQRYVELGGRVSRVVLGRQLPRPNRWCGIVHLVETRGFDLYEPLQEYGRLRPRQKGC